MPSLALVTDRAAADASAPGQLRRILPRMPGDGPQHEESAPLTELLRRAEQVELMQA